MNPFARAGIEGRFSVAPISIAERRQHELRVIDIRDAEGERPPASADDSDGLAHIPGARRVAACALRAAAAQWSRTQPLAIVDDDGTAARHVARQLRAMGFCDVVWMAGGMRAWRAAGLPIAFALRGTAEAT